MIRRYRVRTGNTSSTPEAYFFAQGYGYRDATLFNGAYLLRLDGPCHAIAIAEDSEVRAVRLELGASRPIIEGRPLVFDDTDAAEIAQARVLALRPYDLTDGELEIAVAETPDDVCHLPDLVLTTARIRIALQSFSSAIRYLHRPRFTPGAQLTCRVITSGFSSGSVRIRDFYAIRGRTSVNDLIAGDQDSTSVTVTTDPQTIEQAVYGDVVRIDVSGDSTSGMVAVLEPS